MSSPSEGFLVVEPSQELRFKGPFHTDVSTTSLRISNTSDKRITFKIKTTAPKHYCVRPNQGIIESNSTVDVTVMLQPFDYDPNEKNKHKFMVQTMFVPADSEDIDLESLWKNTSAENVMTSNKLRSVFEIADTGAETAVDKSPESKTSKSGAAGGSGDELRRIKDELGAIKAENIQLKEESSRLRRTTRTDGGEPTYMSSASSHHHQGAPAVTAPADPMMYYVLAVIALVVGVIIGKLF